jgi:putative glutamine amidotransferase
LSGRRCRRSRRFSRAFEADPPRGVHRLRGSGVTRIAISTVIAGGGEYARAVAVAGGEPRLLEFTPETLDAQLDGSAGVLLTGGGDVDPSHYGGAPDLVTEVDAKRDAFELALVRRARFLALPTLCICRGLQVANVAFGGTLIEDIGTALHPAAAALHRRIAGDEAERGLIAGHDVTIAADSLLAAIVANTKIVTGSRHHQSIATVAPDLRLVAATPDGIVEAVEARFASPFWLAVQWHPESTLAADDGGASRAIFAAFVAAASRPRAFANREDTRNGT